MNQQTDDQADHSSKPAPSKERRRRARPIFVSLIVLVTIAAALGAWLFWPKQAGKPVAAPRTVSFQESPQPMATVEQRLTLTPEQLRSVQLKIETVGEVARSEEHTSELQSHSD